MFQLRTYTLQNEEVANLYFEVYWKRHLKSLPKFGINVIDVFLENDLIKGGHKKVVALLNYENKNDYEEVDKKYMHSQEFKEDMKDFPMDKIVSVESLYLKKNISDLGR